MHQGLVFFLKYFRKNIEWLLAAMSGFIEEHCNINLGDRTSDQVHD
jgi:hypothetical protein